ncbi:amidase [Phreatobacter aquaticus]|uniref:Indoleacetamide hydrolase n=1 Tax=Phreatobacter aquaticus TaxID=2570229 RepID=A0A4D7QLW8_9HYPH|nr:amidase [Phreatobacter aquaticus]QCK88215.1 amidase [Phreatobacter aquaticus]
MTSPADLAPLGAIATASAIADGKVSARAVIDHALERIGAENTRLHAFIAVTSDEARAEADMLDALQAKGHRRGPFHGVPLAVKDIIDVSGQKTRAGSVTRDHLGPASADAWCVARLRAAGAVVVGKTNTVEYAFGGWGTNVIAGTPVNPHDRKVHRVPGGSSSGSGVAVGAGLVPLAFGTDTGGSVRLPAAWCGLVGHKTSYGLISRSGVVPLALAFDTIGPMTRTVRDAAVMAQVMLGSDPTDASTTGAPGLDLVTGLEAGVKGLTLGLLDLGGLTVDPEVAAAIDASAKALEKAGARIVRVTLPETVSAYTGLCGALMMVEGYSRYGKLADADPCLVGAPVAGRMRGGKAISGPAYFDAVEARIQRIASANAALDGIDALILPTTLFTAIPVSEVDEDGAPGGLTRFVNYLEWCGVSVPVAKSRAGMPIGLQVVARRYRDDLALRIARAAELAAGGPLALPA